MALSYRSHWKLIRYILFSFFFLKCEKTNLLFNPPGQRFFSCGNFCELTLHLCLLFWTSGSDCPESKLATIFVFGCNFLQKKKKSQLDLGPVYASLRSDGENQVKMRSMIITLYKFHANKLFGKLIMAWTSALTSAAHLTEKANHCIEAKGISYKWHMKHKYKIMHINLEPYDISIHLYFVQNKDMHLLEDITFLW